MVKKSILCALSGGLLLLAQVLCLVGPCHVAAEESPSPIFSPVVSIPSPQAIFSTINEGGPALWPEDKGITSTLASPTAPAIPASSTATTTGNVSVETMPPSTPEATPPRETVVAVPAAQPAADKPKEVVYVDEKGNPVPKPLDPENMLAEAAKLVDERKYEAAVPLLEQVKELRLTADQRERTLYLYSDAVSMQYVDKPVVGFDIISAATSEAMNANQRSPRVPDALFRLGMINVEVGNLVEAEGYFKTMLRRFPEKGDAAKGFRRLGDALRETGQHARAEAMYRIVVNSYPSSPTLKEASVGLCRVLAAQERWDEAAQIMDFVNLRWARYYLEDPSFLKEEAALAHKRGKLDKALEQYWLFYNLLPDDADNAALLIQMGDMYFAIQRPVQAAEIFREVQRRFPETENSMLARLRLAEGGVYDGPVISLAEMSSVLARKGEPRSDATYRAIIKDFPQQPFGQLALLKYAMWQLYAGQYTEAMGTAADFMDMFPENPSVPEAKNIVWEAFSKEKELSLQEHNYGRLLILWEGFPLVRERYGKLDPELRYALAQAMLERGDERDGYAMLGEFLKSPQNATYGEPAFVQFFNHYLQKSDWNAVLDLGDVVNGWRLEPELRKQVDYALALAAENLGLTGRALTQWKTLAERSDIPLYQRAYANYFLARDAEKRRDINDAYTFNKNVLEIFSQLKEERSDRAEPERIREAVAALMDITEVANRIPESLEWVARYQEFVTEDSPEYAPLRFREARLYRKLGDAAKTRAILEDIVKREPDSAFGKAAASELRTLEVSRDLQQFLPEKPKERTTER